MTAARSRIMPPPPPKPTGMAVWPSGRSLDAKYSALAAPILREALACPTSKRFPQIES